MIGNWFDRVSRVSGYPRPYLPSDRVSRVSGYPSSGHSNGNVGMEEMRNKMMDILKLMKKKEARDRERRRRQHISDYYKRKEEELQFYRRMVVEALEADIQKRQPGVAKGR